MDAIKLYAVKVEIAYESSGETWIFTSLEEAQAAFDKFKRAGRGDGYTLYGPFTPGDRIEDADEVTSVWS